MVPSGSARWARIGVHRVPELVTLTVATRIRLALDSWSVLGPKLVVELRGLGDTTASTETSARRALASARQHSGALSRCPRLWLTVRSPCPGPSHGGRWSRTLSGIGTGSTPSTPTERQSEGTSWQGARAWSGSARRRIESRIARCWVSQPSGAGPRGTSTRTREGGARRRSQEDWG